MERIEGESIGRVFQEMTKMGMGPGREAMRPSDRMKGGPRGGKGVIDLPAPGTTGGAPLWEILSRRRSVRDYTEESLSVGELSQLLWASQGVTGQIGPYRLRTAPSAGARYPCETYVVVNRAEGVENGVYRYLVEKHALECLREGDFSREIAEAALGQEMTATAPVAFVWTAIFERTVSRYGQRGYRYVYLDAGHIAAHVSLAAVAMGLATCQIAALFDDAVNAVVGCDGVEESVLYMTVVGRRC